jgi:hypothetical protein
VAIGASTLPRAWLDDTLIGRRINDVSRTGLPIDSLAERARSGHSVRPACVSWGPIARGGGLGLIAGADDRRALDADEHLWQQET